MVTQSLVAILCLIFQRNAYCFLEILVGLFCITKTCPFNKQRTFSAVKWENFSQCLFVCYEFKLSSKSGTSCLLKWGELSSKSRASCLGASSMWGELSWGELSLGRVVLIPSHFFFLWDLTCGRLP